MNKVIQLLQLIVDELNRQSTIILKLSEVREEEVHEYLTTKDVLALINRNEKTLYSWIKKGLLTPCSRQGTNNLYRKVDVLNAIDKSRNL